MGMCERAREFGSKVMDVITTARRCVGYGKSSLAADEQHQRFVSVFRYELSARRALSLICI